MTDRTFTDAEIEAGYAALAADLRREAEERQALDAAIRRNSRRVSPRNAGLDELGNPIPGMWNVILSTGEPYEQSYDRGVGLFDTLASAEKYCDAFDKEANIASGKAINQYESTHCRIEFIPFGEYNPVFHTLYTVETERHDDDINKRTITDVTAEVISEKSLLRFINNGTSPLIAAIWENKSLAVSLDNETETGPKDAIIASEVFGPVTVFSGEYENGTTYSYTEAIERFLTFDPANVVLDKPKTSKYKT